MPNPQTEMQTFVQLAVKYGNVDPGDLEAVDRFFEIDVPKLPEEKQLEIFEQLIGDT
jgi:hypothetical protein